MRITFLGAAGVVTLVLALAGALPAAGNPSPVGGAQYVVRLDPRLCPSPLCGGYWVALANRSRTRCSDGALRPRCYAARAVDEERHPLTVGVPEGAIVRAVLEPWSFPGAGELGSLVVAEVRAPIGPAAVAGFHRLRDLGIRCVRAPCFSLRSTRLNAETRVTLSGLDLSPARPAPAQRASAEAALRTSGGLIAAGRIVASPDGGRVFRASRIYLRLAKPRG